MSDPRSQAHRGLRLAGVLASIPILIGLDQWTKQLAIKHLYGEPAISFWSGIGRLQYAENKGAFLGAGDSLSEEARFLILTVGTGILLAAVTVFLLRQWQMPRLRFTSLVLILAGGVGNLIDRVAQGFVVDFMVLGLGPLRTGIFNVADMFITTAVILLAFEMLPGRQPVSPEPLVEEPSSSDC